MIRSLTKRSRIVSVELSVMGRCAGRFSDETVRLLREYIHQGNALLHFPCAVCGRRVPAENKAGKWVPKIHYAAKQRGPYKTGRRGLKE